MPLAVHAALLVLRKDQAADRLLLGEHYADRHGLVFRDSAGRPMSRQRVNVRFEEVCEAAGIGRGWQPRETRHSFVSIASSNSVSIEDIADAAGHVNSNVTRAVYRHPPCRYRDESTRRSGSRARRQEHRVNTVSGSQAWLPDLCHNTPTRADAMTTTCV